MRRGPSLCLSILPIRTIQFSSGTAGQTAPCCAEGLSPVAQAGGPGWGWSRRQLQVPGASPTAPCPAALLPGVEEAGAEEAGSSVDSVTSRLPEPKSPQGMCRHLPSPESTHLSNLKLPSAASHGNSEKGRRPPHTGRALRTLPAHHLQCLHWGLQPCEEPQARQLPARVPFQPLPGQ